MHKGASEGLLFALYVMGEVVWTNGRRSCKRLPVNVHLAVRKSPPLVSSSAKLLEESDVSEPHTRVLSKGKLALF